MSPSKPTTSAAESGFTMSSPELAPTIISPIQYLSAVSPTESGLGLPPTESESAISSPPAHIKSEPLSTPSVRFKSEPLPPPSIRVKSEPLSTPSVQFKSEPLSPPLIHIKPEPLSPQPLHDVPHHNDQEKVGEYSALVQTMSNFTTAKPTHIMEVGQYCALAQLLHEIVDIDVHYFTLPVEKINDEYAISLTEERIDVTKELSYTKTKDTQSLPNSPELLEILNGI
ncbi:hypothetical protein FQN55_000106 [Onygenales sp. PD_40]|nr:hypothetical protein FQN55_000106 [Onygenales sp. PD_40]